MRHYRTGYVTRQAKLKGREQAIWAERDRKLEAARQRRAARCQATRLETLAEACPQTTT